MDKLYLKIGNAPRFQCYPLGYAESSIVATKEKDNVFYRRKFDGELVFTGCDFSKIAEIELSDNRCSEILFTIVREIGTYWEGYFTPTMCEFDFDLRTVSVTPQPKDKYDLFLNNKEAQINIIDTDEVTVKAISIGKTYTHCHRWMDVMEAIVKEIDDSVTLVSDFFTTDENYATQQPNKHNNVVVAQKSDIKRPDASEAARVGYMSFELMTDILRDLFNCYWYITEANEFRVEHISYFDEQIGDTIDLRGEIGEASTRRYGYDAGQIPISESVVLEGYYDDFIGLPITYDKKCALGEATESKYDICNDLFGLLWNRVETADSGFTFIACTVTDGDLICPDALCPIKNDFLTNGYMAMSILMHYYWRHNRPLMSGNMNGSDEDFFSAQANIVQTINLPVCKDLPLYGDYETSLTDVISKKARVRELQVKQDGSNVLTLEYYPERQSGGLPDEKFINVEFKIVPDSGGLDKYMVILTLSHPAPEDNFPVKYDLKYLWQWFDTGTNDWVDEWFCIENTAIEFQEGEMVSVGSVIAEKSGQERIVSGEIYASARTVGYTARYFNVTEDNSISC